VSTRNKLSLDRRTSAPIAVAAAVTIVAAAVAWALMRENGEVERQMFASQGSIVIAESGDVAFSSTPHATARGERCTGNGRYSAIRPGATVEAHAPNGVIVGFGTITEGQGTAECEFGFEFPRIADQFGRYDLYVGDLHLGTVEEDALRSGRSVVLAG